MVEVHTCTRSNKGGNKRATQGRIANVVTDKLKSDGDVSPYELRNWFMKTYIVDVKEGSVVEIDFELVGGKKLFKRFFICLAACSRGFVSCCRPYIGLDACHLKGKFNGVLVAATGIDGNNSIFPITYCVLKSEKTQSWPWFLNSLKKAIRMPNGLVISSDMQKGLEVAIMNVYPNVEHRECIRHLYSNFKKHFRGDFFNKKLWAATKTYRPTKHDRLLKEISDKNEYAIAYLNTNHKKIWSRSKFGTTSKCDYITNNISKTFNYWIGKLRYKLFDKKRNLVNTWNDTLVPIAKNHLNDIAKNLGEYEVTRSCDNQAEVKYKGTRWEVNLDERKCSCRVWRVQGRPCVHAVAFIAFIRDANWDKYVDPYFTIKNFKAAYAF
uniref:SWIM-type domain-containing protein n=1 Tax=Lactuca sativa TaxID=4236 RepID=A0A9R1UMS2_LACSA|nr:hypothetical protein LSAT_V11C800395070 [Lactuca sativa]